MATTPSGLAVRRAPLLKPHPDMRYFQQNHVYQNPEPHQRSGFCSFRRVVTFLLIVLVLSLAYSSPTVQRVVAKFKRPALEAQQPQQKEPPQEEEEYSPNTYLIVGVQNDPQFAQAVAFSWRLRDANPTFESRALAFPAKEKYLAWLERSREPYKIPLQFSTEHNVAVFKGARFLGGAAALRSDAHATGYTLGPSNSKLRQRNPEPLYKPEKKETTPLPQHVATRIESNIASKSEVVTDEEEGFELVEKTQEEEERQSPVAVEVENKVTEKTASDSSSSWHSASTPLYTPAQVTFKNKIITGYRASEGKKFTNYKPFAQVLEGWTFLYQAPLMASIILVQDQTSASTAMVRYPKALVNNIGWGGQSCLGGSKGTQIQCRMNRAERDGCSYESLKIQPFQARMWIQKECKEFFETRCNDPTALFIQKPSGGQHGAGMKVHQGCDALRAEFASLCDYVGEYPKKKYFIMPYLQPALLDGHKFDVRTYGLIASLDPLLVFYSDGFVRRATTRYSTENLHDEAAHITNSIKQNAKDDHFWDFARLSNYLRENHAFPPSFMETLFRKRAKKVTEFVFQAARPFFKKRKNRFQLFAFDWIVDHQGGVHLLEVNSNPLVGTPYPGLEHHFPLIWSELMRLVMDIQTGQMLVAKMRSPALSKYWQLVLSEYEEKKEYNSCEAFEGDENPPLMSTEPAKIIKSLEEIQRAVESEMQDERLIAEEEESEQIEASGIGNVDLFKSLKSIPEVDLGLPNRADAASIPCPAKMIDSNDPGRRRCILAPGSEDETVYHILDSGRPGPIIFIVAGVHGNEGAGVIAARHVVKNWRPAKGCLVVLERANARGVAANHRFVPAAHQSPFYDLNRAFPHNAENDGHHHPSRFLVTAIWDLMTEIRPDFLFDLHEGRAFFARSTSPDQQQLQEMGEVLENVGSTTGGKVSKGNSIVTTLNAEKLAKVVADACNEDLDTVNRKFYIMAPPIQGGLASKVNVAFGTRAMLFETTLVLSLETRARQHLFMLAVALRSIQVLPMDFDLSTGGDVEPCVVTRKTCSIKA